VIDASNMDRPPVAAHVLDAGEAACADLLIRLVRTIRPLPAGTILEVVGYSRSAIHDIPAWCRLTGNPLLHMEGTQPVHFLIQKGEK
jgi:tRNA 2-thiouridine synthesizing protein A